jgi:hypothetical protein
MAKFDASFRLSLLYTITVISSVLGPAFPLRAGKEQLHYQRVFSKHNSAAGSAPAGFFDGRTEIPSSARFIGGPLAKAALVPGKYRACR